MLNHLTPRIKWMIAAVLVAGLVGVYATSRGGDGNGDRNGKRPGTAVESGPIQAEGEAGQRDGPITTGPESARPQIKADHAEQALILKPDVPEGFLKIDKVAGTLKLAGGDIVPGERIPPEHTCYRDNKSPALSWSGVPEDTKSFVVLFERVGDVPETEIYWGLYNIPASMHSIQRGIPVGPILSDGTLQLKNDFAQPGYVGPCIPRGRHPFRLRIFALDLDTGLPAGMTKEQLFSLMNGHILDVATVDVEHYHRF